MEINNHPFTEKSEYLVTGIGDTFIFDEILQYIYDCKWDSDLNLFKTPPLRRDDEKYIRLRSFCKENDLGLPECTKDNLEIAEVMGEHGPNGTTWGWTLR